MSFLLPLHAHVSPLFSPIVEPVGSIQFASEPACSIRRRKAEKDKSSIVSPNISLVDLHFFIDPWLHPTPGFTQCLSYPVNMHLEVQFGNSIIFFCQPKKIITFHYKNDYSSLGCYASSKLFSL